MYKSMNAAECTLLEVAIIQPNMEDPENKLPWSGPYAEESVLQGPLDEASTPHLSM